MPKGRNVIVEFTQAEAIHLLADVSLALELADLMPNNRTPDAIAKIRHQLKAAQGRLNNG